MKRILSATPGIAQVFSRTDVELRHLPPGMHERQMLHSFYPSRSGDVIAIPMPYYFSGTDPVNHMTGYIYDRSVPLLIAGPGDQIWPDTSNRRRHRYCADPVLPLRNPPPSLSEGHLLSDILK